MPDTSEPLLVFDNGDSLVSSPHGDRFWIVNAQGQSTPCALQQACRYWQEYEQSLQPGYQAPTDSTLRPRRPAATGTTQSDSTKGTEPVEYTPWQRDLLLKLGLTPEDIDPLSRNKSR